MMEKFDFTLKQFNTNNIYTYFVNHKEATRQDLAQTLNLTLPTVTKNIDYL